MFSEKWRFCLIQGDLWQGLNAMFNRRLPLHSLALMVCGFAFPPTCMAQTSETRASARRPNVIIILTDDLGQADISAFAKNPLKVPTPNIDRLAKEGIKLTQFYVSVPICSPSRAAILSGMNGPETQLTTFLQWRKGNTEADQNDYMDPALAFLPKSFKAAGYATAHSGKWHLGGGRDVDNAPSISQYGYDEFWGTTESPEPDPKLGAKPSWGKDKPPSQLDRWNTTGYMVDKALDFLKRHHEQPCFITLWPEDLHTPFAPSPEMLEKHGGARGKERSIENFYGVLENYDRQIGRLLDGLKGQGLDENTLVIFTGDHGPNPDYNRLRTGGLRGKKGSLYEGGIRQPAIVRLPGVIPAEAENQSAIMGAVDLLPTLTSMAGIPVVPEATGKVVGEDFSAALKGQNVKRLAPLTFSFGRVPPRPDHPVRSPQLAIRDGDFKLLVNRNGSDVRLYNLREDVAESTNIADQCTTVVESLKKQVLGWSRTLPHRTHPPASGVAGGNANVEEE